MRRPFLEVLAWLLGVPLLVWIGVSCTTPKTTTVTPRPSAVTNAVELEALTPSLAMARASVAARPNPKPLPLAWDAVPGADHYLLYLSHGNDVWYKTINVGTNTTVNLTNVVPPIEFKVTAVIDASEGPASSEVCYGASTNGSATSGNFVFIASPTNTYVLSNAPLISGPWTQMVRLTNVSGLRVVSLPGQTGRISLGIER